jgi:hypothetical protein
VAILPCHHRALNIPGVWGQRPHAFDRSEAGDQRPVIILELWIVETGIAAGKADDFAIMVSGLLLIASGVADHAKAVVSVIYVRPALNNCPCGTLGIVKSSSIDQGDHCIGGLVNLSVAVFAEVGVMVRRMICRLGSDNGPAFVSRGQFVLGEAALLVLLAAAARAAIIPSDFDHFLYSTGRMDALYQALLADARFHEQLLSFDRDLATRCRAAGCADCGGVLHAANYARKPRGRPIALGEEHDRRFSFCCARDGCRDRATPPSLRFLGRKVYLAVTVTLISAMRDGLTERRFGKLAEAIGVDRRTVARWRGWWLADFPATPLWRAKSASLMPPVDAARLPAALLERFAGDAARQLIGFLSFLGPITAGASMQVF